MRKKYQRRRNILNIIGIIAMFIGLTVMFPILDEYGDIKNSIKFILGLIGSLTFIMGYLLVQFIDLIEFKYPIK